jgi:hypothetical protein
MILWRSLKSDGRLKFPDGQGADMVEGFQFAGISAGIKKNDTRDLGLST